MKKHILFYLGLAVLASSCNDFLDREPMDEIPTNLYLLHENDLAAYTAKLYESLPSHQPGSYDIGVFGFDNNSDNQAGSNPEKIFVKGESRVPQSGGSWNFNEIRSTNYFINRVRGLLESGELGGSEANNKHYLGEAYFFRAYFYANKLDSLGDFPIIKQIIPDNYEAVKLNSKRRPRNEVARFIIQDLDSAYYFMSPTPPVSNRLTRDCAALLKSRVALFEGTWEKYHKGTARVPGGPGWPGAQKDYLKNFSINIDNEIRYFLEEAKKAAQLVADNYTLYNDYPALFNSNSLDGIPEVLLWRAYNAGITPAVNHFVVGYLQRNGGGNSGYTRSMIDTYLMKNGLPIYASGSEYKGDRTYQDVADGRDPRLAFNTMLPGDMLTKQAAMTEAIIDGAGFYYRAPITEMAENRCTTGYSIKKGLTTDPSQGPTLPSVTGCVIFRAAEAYLNYMEADYELTHTLDANSQKYWKALRERAGMDTDYQKTITHTNLEKEVDFARYSGSTLVDATLYNIRRERRIELAAEGFRMRDLRRWCALDKMQDYQVEGFNLWAENYKRYTTPAAGLDKNFDKPLGVIDLKEAGTEGANVSARSDGEYLKPYRVIASNIAYNGYNWNPNRYLYPIAFDHFRLTTETEGSSDYSSSPIYQNPGWKIETNSLPEGD